MSNQVLTFPKSNFNATAPRLSTYLEPKDLKPIVSEKDTIIQETEKWNHSMGLGRSIAKTLYKDGFDLATQDLQEIIYNTIRNKKNISKKHMKNLFKIFVEEIKKIKLCEMEYLKNGMDDFELETSLDIDEANGVEYLPVFREVDGSIYMTPLPSIFYNQNLLL